MRQQSKDLPLQFRYTDARGRWVSPKVVDTETEEPLYSKIIYFSKDILAICWEFMYCLKYFN